jgi:hypothetical protein
MDTWDQNWLMKSNSCREEKKKMFSLSVGASDRAGSYPNVVESFVIGTFAADNDMTVSTAQDWIGRYQVVFGLKLKRKVGGYLLAGSKVMCAHDGAACRRRAGKTVRRRW